MTENEDTPRLRALEFYSGIGGMHHALRLAAPNSEVVKAFEISDVANAVYKHNFNTPVHQGNIEALTKKQLDKLGANCWLLAPPCQPYTRQGHKKHSLDARAGSFTALLMHLPGLQSPPELVLVENVVGFESSDTREHMMEILGKAGYTAQEFILTPSQYGIPYSRPRYFCVAKRGHAFLLQPPVTQAPSQHTSGGQGEGDPSEGEGQQAEGAGDTQAGSHQSQGQGTAVCYVPPYVLVARAKGLAAEEHPVRPLSDFLVQDPSRDIPTPAPHTQLQTQTQPQAHAQPPQPSQQVHAHPSCGDKRAAEGTTTITISDTTDPDCTPTPTCNTDQAAPQHVSKQARLDSPAKELDTRLREDTTNGCSADSSTMAEGASSSLDPWSFFMVPHKTLDQSADVVDVVTSRSTRCKCFTKSYTQFARGTGSVLATHPDHQDPGACTRQEAHAREAAARGLQAVPSVVAAGSGEDGGAREGQAGDNGTVVAGAGGSRRLHTLAPKLDKEVLAARWKRMDLRYFTPTEVARLHSFPDTFSFPAHVTLRQRYQMLGNSLSAAVVADLLTYALMKP